MKATRRRSAEVRELLLKAAAQVFAAKGLDGATTAEIAAAAGVSESTLFRHFPAKSDLFATAALEPFTLFMNEFASVWERQRSEGLASGELMRNFVTELYDKVCQRREVILALLSADIAANQPAVTQTRTTFTRLFAELNSIGEAWESDRGSQLPGLELRERILVGIITAMGVFNRWFLTSANGRLYPREAVIDALIDFARHGALHPSESPIKPAKAPQTRNRRAPAAAPAGRAGPAKRRRSSR